jgi:hypothetical protein
LRCATKSARDHFSAHHFLRCLVMISLSGTQRVLLVAAAHMHSIRITWSTPALSESPVMTRGVDTQQEARINKNGPEMRSCSIPFRRLKTLCVFGVPRRLASDAESATWRLGVRANTARCPVVTFRTATTEGRTAHDIVHYHSSGRGQR